jgi:hypothetical protein
MDLKIAIRRRQLDKNMVRYFNELTNMAQLTEEEVARIIARRYGEQSEKKAIKIRTWRRISGCGFVDVSGKSNRN